MVQFASYLRRVLFFLVQIAQLSLFIGNDIIKWSFSHLRDPIAFKLSICLLQIFALEKRMVTTQTRAIHPDTSPVPVG